MTTAPPAKPTYVAASISVLRMATQRLYEEYTAYAPPNMACVGAEYKGVCPALYALAEALRVMAMKSQTELPIHAKVAQEMVNTFQRVTTVARMSDSLYLDFLQVHSEDIWNLEQPRTGQEKWNIAVGRQTDGGGIINRPSVLQERSAHIASVYSTQYAPDRMMRVYDEYCAISPSIENMAFTIKILADRTRDYYPVHQVIEEQLAARVNDLFAAASEASSLMKIFRLSHPNDLRKHENPRKGPAGERQWDY